MSCLVAARSCDENKERAWASRERLIYLSIERNQGCLPATRPDGAQKSSCLELRARRNGAAVFEVDVIESQPVT